MKKLSCCTLFFIVISTMLAKAMGPLKGKQIVQVATSLQPTLQAPITQQPLISSKQLMITLFPILEERPDLEEAFSNAKIFNNDLPAQGYYLDRILALDSASRLQQGDVLPEENLKSKVTSLTNGLFFSFFYAPAHTFKIMEQLNDAQIKNPSSQPIFSAVFSETLFPPANSITQEIAAGQAKYTDGFSQRAPIIHYAALMRPTAIQALIDLGADAIQEIDYQSVLSIAIDRYSQPILSLIERTAAATNLSFDLQAATYESSYNGRKEWVEAFLLYGADPKDALENALEFNRDIGAPELEVPQEILQLLEEAVAKKQSAGSTSAPSPLFKKPQPKKARIKKETN